MIFQNLELQKLLGPIGNRLWSLAALVEYTLGP
jgi:hypothetical protein